MSGAPRKRQLATEERRVVKGGLLLRIPMVAITPHGLGKAQARGAAVLQAGQCRAAGARCAPDQARGPPPPETGSRRPRSRAPCRGEQVYRFAWGAIEAGRREAAAAAVVCFEFLQRPENVLAGYLAWPRPLFHLVGRGFIVVAPLSLRQFAR
jgi:hypothetical protein